MFKLILVIAIIAGCTAIHDLEFARTKRVNKVECGNAMTSIGGKGNKFLTSAVQLMQNSFRDMATGSSGEVRNKFRKDIARIFKAMEKYLVIDTKLISLIKGLEGTGTSIEDAGKKAASIDFSPPLKQQGTDNVCAALQGVIDDLVTKMQLNQQKNDLTAKILEKSLEVVKAGLSVASDTAEDTGIGIAASVGIKAISAALDQVDASWFKSKLNSIMRISRTAFWNAVSTVVNPVYFNIKMDGKVISGCNKPRAIKILDDLKWTFKSLITIDDRTKFRNACRFGGDKDEKTFRIGTGQTVWQTATKFFSEEVATTKWGQAMSKEVGALGDVATTVMQKTDDKEDNS